MPASKSPKNKRNSLLVIIIVVLVVVVLGTAAMLFLKNVNPSEASLENAATEELYAGAAALTQQWEANKTYYLEVGSAEAILDRIKFSTTGYSWRVTSPDQLQWEARLQSQQVTGGGLWAKDVKVFTCLRFTATLPDGTLDVLPVPCPQEHTAYGKEILLDKAKLTP